MTRKILPLAVGAAVLVAGGLAIAAGGARLMPAQEARVDAKAVEPGTSVLAAPKLATREVTPLAPGTKVAQAEPIVPSVGASPREVAPGAAPPTTDAPLERIEPRAPLSDLYKPSAKKPDPKPAKAEENWRIIRLFNPVASAAGRLEVKGHKIALAGIEPIPVDEKCSWNGTEWPCGTVARTAFRQWLRSRAVQCKVPPVAKPEEIRADCSIGRADISDWLISNGWARPEADGPYAEAGEKAKNALAGIYGAPPKRVSIIVTPRLPSIQPGDTTLLDADPLESTPNELNQDPEPGFTSPAAAAPPPTAPETAFPPPPPPAEPTP